MAYSGPSLRSEAVPRSQQIMARPRQQAIGLSAGNASFMEADTAASANEATDFLRDMQVADLCEVRAPAGIEAALVSSRALSLNPGSS